ncbi:Phosphomutase-like protein 3 [Diaporthe amygdali]|uniref:Phosphomutase-like protein 3 n=1 Tax=Phomopsis amygdali TaxID=1214568 RepID=UPI0022FECEB6|nr:Phosphomutase-like protein 3 [Diaporthe amygdali]KAJ0124235.1 Phosphomutase-like protein 3 [Diaporthe amygdali]
MGHPTRLQFSAVSGFFQHDEEPEGSQFRATTTSNLGLLALRIHSRDEDVQKKEWEKFHDRLRQLNHDGVTKYKLFYVIRHGEGHHNVKEAQVGRSEWEDVFENDEEVVISLTIHSGAIRALYAAIDHRDVWVSPGAMVPVLIQAETV